MKFTIDQHSKQIITALTKIFELISGSELTSPERVKFYDLSQRTNQRVNLAIAFEPHEIRGP
jgi:hypothetical protein